MISIEVASCLVHCLLLMVILYHQVESLAFLLSDAKRHAPLFSSLLLNKFL